MSQYTTGSFTTEDFLKELVNQTWFEENLKKTCNPLYIYHEDDKGPGDAVWLYSANRKTYVQIKLQVKVEPMEDMEDYKSGDNVMCMIGHEIFLISFDNIKEIGYN